MKKRIPSIERCVDYNRDQHNNKDCCKVGVIIQLVTYCGEKENLNLWYNLINQRMYCKPV